MPVITPRCASCGIAMPIWRAVQCTKPTGHEAKDDISVTVTCNHDVDGHLCGLNAGHHGDHKETP